MKQVRTHGDWEEWITFFLEGVIFVANDVVATSEKLQWLLNKDRKRLLTHPKVTIASMALLEELPKKPIISVHQAVEKLDLTTPPVSKAIKILVDCGILIETTGKKKDRLYRYHEYLDVLSKDTE